MGQHVFVTCVSQTCVDISAAGFLCVFSQNCIGSSVPCLTATDSDVNA